MTEFHPQWGPNVSQYLPTVDGRLSDSFDQYLAKKETMTEASDGLIPLPLLETTLAVGENMHKVGFQHGDKLFPILVSTVRGYIKLHKGAIFDNYYGFLCIRHITRMACIATLTSADEFDEFMDKLEPEMTPREVTDKLAQSALEIMTEALYTEDEMNIKELFGSTYSSSGNAFMIGGGLSYEDVEYLVEVLWRGRKWLVPLQEAGLLPGLPALLFVLCEMTVFSKKPSHKKPWNRVQELLLRCYLGDTTTPERTLLRQLCRFADNEIGLHDLPEDYIPIDLDDARTVVQAYVDIFAPPTDPSLAPIVLLDISRFLFIYVYLLLTNRQRGMILEDMAPDVIRTMLTRLGLEFDRELEGEMSPQKRVVARDFAADVFGYISLLEKRIVSSEVRKASSQMLFDIDLHGLVGRILLLITRDTGNAPTRWRHFLSSFPRLEQTIHSLPPLPAPQLGLVALEWRKVFLHLMYLLHSTIRNRIPEDCLVDAMESWDLVRPPTVKRPPDFYECAYPRCAIRVAYGRVPEARIMCERCSNADYCSRRCQEMHWVLHTSNSHALECRKG